MRENLIQGKHSGGLSGHFGQENTFSLVSNFYLFPQMQHDVKKFVESCKVLFLGERKHFSLTKRRVHQRENLNWI